MSKILKLAARIVGLLILLYIIAMVLLLLFVHPDTYKPLITKAFYKETGRQMTIKGKIKLSLFPLPGIKVTQVNIANQKGFKAPKSANYFVKIGAAQVRLHLLPLFKGEVHPSKLLLTQASVNLITTPSGKNNWSDLLTPKKQKNKIAASSKTAPKDTKTSPTQMDITDSDFPEIMISKTNIHFINQQTGHTTNVTDFVFWAKPMKTSNLYSFDISCKIHRNNPNVLIRFRTQSTAMLNLSKKYYRFDKLKIVAELLQFDKVERPVTLELEGNLVIQNQNLHSSFNGLLRHHKGTIKLALSQKSSLINLSLSTNQLSIEPIITAFSGRKLMAGTLNLRTQLSTRGNSLDMWLRQLNGNGQFNIAQGAFYGLDLKYTVMNALNSILFGKSIVKITPDKSSKTSFKEVSASYRIRNGLVSSKNIVIDGNQLKAVGSGTINLPKERIDIKMLATYTPQPKWKIPLKITGNLFSPTVEPDVEALAKQFYKSKIQKDIGKTLDKIKGLDLKKIFD